VRPFDAFIASEVRRECPIPNLICVTVDVFFGLNLAGFGQPVDTCVGNCATHSFEFLLKSEIEPFSHVVQVASGRGLPYKLAIKEMQIF
jgi:hypothetical protein